MEDGKRRAFTHQQVAARAKKQQEKGVPLKGTGPLNLLLKRKMMDKVDRPPKKPKVVTSSIVRETPLTTLLPPLPHPRKGKGLMTEQGLDSKKCTVLLREDLQYAIGQLSSIIKVDDYEDLGKYATEAMGETGLFSLAQVCVRPSFFPVALLPLFLMMF